MPARPSQQNASRRCPRGSRDESAAGKVQLRLARHPQPKCSRSCGCPSSPRARQSDREFGELANLAIDLDRPAVLLGHDVVADRQSQASSFSGRLGREEWLKELVLHVSRDADPVVACTYFDGITQIARGHLQGRLEFRIAPLLLSLGGGIEAVAEQIQADAGDVLWDEFNRGNGCIEITFESYIEALILSAATVVSEVQRLINEGVEINATTLAGATPGMLQHAADDAIGTSSMFGNLFEVAGQHPNGFIDLGP